MLRKHILLMDKHDSCFLSFENDKHRPKLIRRGEVETSNLTIKLEEIPDAVEEAVCNTNDSKDTLILKSFKKVDNIKEFYMIIYAHFAHNSTNRHLTKTSTRANPSCRS